MKILPYSSNEEIVSEIGARIKAARVAYPMPQNELAEMTGLSPRTISNIETGRDVSFSPVIEILRALDMLHGLELMIPEPGIRPSQIAELGKPRKRAPRRKSSTPDSAVGWKWGDET